MSNEDVDKTGDDPLSIGAATVFSVDEPASEVDKDLKVDNDADNLNVLSEEQTNAALAALEGHVDVVDAEPAGSSVKRKAGISDVDIGSPPRVKQRRTPTRVAWEDRVAMLKAYKEEHGDLLIPIRYKKNPSLGKFIHNTREQFKLFHKKTPDGYKKKCSLTAGRIQQLDEIGFVWSTNRTERQDEDWGKRLEQLKEYKKKHGDCLVPHGYEVDPSFAEWIHRQRTTYASLEKKPNKMVKERMDRLEEIGFNFTVHFDKWMEHWTELKQYKDKHGHCQVPTHYSENPKLGRWVHTQRHQRRLKAKGKKNSMTDERIKLLDDLEFFWEVKPGLDRPRATWQQRYDELRAFHSKHGHFCVPAHEDIPLQGWAHEQKNRLRNLQKNKGKDFTKRMGPERVELLLQIGFTATTELYKKPTDGGDSNTVSETTTLGGSKHDGSMIDTLPNSSQESSAACDLERKPSPIVKAESAVPPVESQEKAVAEQPERHPGARLMTI